MMMDVKRMLTNADPQAIDLQAKLYRGFGDPSRLSILVALRQGPLTVSEIVQKTNLSQSNASNHLGCLRDCGLVTARQQGRHVTYQLSDDRVGRLLELTESLVRDVARGVYECTRYTVASRSRSAPPGPSRSSSTRQHSRPQGSQRGTQMG